MKLRSLLLLCVPLAFVSVAIELYLWFLLPTLASAQSPNERPDWLSFAFLSFLAPGYILMNGILPWQYTVMSCPGCQPVHKDLVVSTAAVALNVLFWTAAAFVGGLLFRYTRRSSVTRFI